MKTLSRIISSLPARRVLHSFPTRRSSDLMGELARKLKETSLEIGAAPVSPERLAELTAPVDKGTISSAVRCETNIDRKSTRLNSSHDQISYAVFCLKKKNLTSKT